MEGRRGEKQRRKALAAERLARERAEAKTPRNCYCGPGDDHCATCSVCGRPGHLRHFPGAAPYTGSWCDFHYQRLRFLHPNGSVGCWIYLALGVFLVALIVRLVG